DPCGGACRERSSDIPLVGVGPQPATGIATATRTRACAGAGNVRRGNRNLWAAPLSHGRPLRRSPRVHRRLPCPLGVVVPTPRPLGSRRGPFRSHLLVATLRTLAAFALLAS